MTRTSLNHDYRDSRQDGTSQSVQKYAPTLSTLPLRRRVQNQTDGNTQLYPRAPSTSSEGYTLGILSTLHAFVIGDPPPASGDRISPAFGCGLVLEVFE